MFMAGKRFEKKKQRRKGGNVLLNLLLVLCIGVMLFCGYKLVTSYLEYKVGDDAYASITAGAVKKKQAVSPNSGENSASSGDSEQDTDEPLDVDFSVLSAMNADVAAWIYSADTVIDYPVVQGSDNVYYLDHIFDGTYNKLGTLFVDCRNAPGFSDWNTIIYGHNMNNGSMFASLTNYTKQAYYEAHPEMFLVTPNGTFRLELFSGYVTPSDSDAYTFSFADASAFSEFLENIRARSDFDSPVSVEASDRIVTLSTCTYDFEDARYVVHGKLVPVAD